MTCVVGKELWIMQELGSGGFLSFTVVDRIQCKVGKRLAGRLRNRPVRGVDWVYTAVVELSPFWVVDGCRYHIG